MGGVDHFTNLGPYDVGANFDFQFGALEAGNMFIFNIYYGADKIRWVSSSSCVLSLQKFVILLNPGFVLLVNAKETIRVAPIHLMFTSFVLRELEVI